MEIIDKIASKIEEIAGDITIAGYLFGSSLKPEGRFKGDIDIALLVEEEALNEGVIRVQNRIYQELRRYLGREDIDLVILNTAPMLLRYAVIRDGVLIYEGDRDERVEFEVRTMLEYFDFSRIRRMFRDDRFERLKDGRFAKPDNGRSDRHDRGGAPPVEEETGKLPR